MGHAVQDALGPEAIIGVPDIQSPFDVATLVWRKEDLLVAMYENPEAVHRLIEKCKQLLIAFISEFKRQFPNGNLSHCPNMAWGPQELGCWLSEDDIGSISAEMFEQFALSSLVEMSETFGGMFIHCCAMADHQYDGFAKIPNLRGLNRVFQYPPGPGPVIEKFSDTTTFLQAWMTEEARDAMLDLAAPNSRFWFQMGADTIEAAKPMYEHLRAKCQAVAEKQDLA